MSISVFDLFTIGIGPSSSHTVGPMRAACRFVERLREQNVLDRVKGVTAEFFGSLGATGRGHGTDRAAMLGLMGHTPESIDPDIIPEVVEQVRASGSLALSQGPVVAFADRTHLVFHRDLSLPGHPNGMRFSALDDSDQLITDAVFYSVGGGFIVDETAIGAERVVEDDTVVPFPFDSADRLMAICAEKNWPIWQVALENEKARRSESEIESRLSSIWAAMCRCVERGRVREGVLPGGLKVPRRSPELFRKLEKMQAINDPLVALDWVDAYALAVSEENAAGGRVVTAPTNGAAGIMPAVMHYALNFRPDFDDRAAGHFLLTAGAIAGLYKTNASISGADVGCQGEVGVACSMAAGALAEFLGGTPAQVENAAEIGMEHNLGLTCDPIGGLVQVPCIERNAMGAVKAINAARIALRGDGRHIVSLDKVIRVMRDTGADMQEKYKETSRGGLAVNVIEC